MGILGKVCKTVGEDSSREGTCNKVVAKEPHEHFAFTTKVKEVINPQTILKVLESDIAECSPKTKPYSADDRGFLNILKNGIVKTPDGHYEMPLPLKSDKLSLSVNRELAVKIWHQLVARFKGQPRSLEYYPLFMKDMIALCAEEVLPDRLGVQDWMVNYVPHTGVYHPKKKTKQIRVVFYCSAHNEGVFLNDHLLQ